MENYVVGPRVGRGAQGSVYRAIHIPTGDTVALKVLPLGDDAEGRNAKRELATLATLRECPHPNVVTLRDAFVHEGSLWIAMTWAAGGTLEQRVRRRPLTADEAWVVCLQLASALCHIHMRGVLHRDVKPANVFLLRESDDVNGIQLGDFGVSTILEAPHARAKTVVGTPYYLSPELCHGQAYSAKSDVWALGVVGFALLHGEMPFDAPNYAALIFRIVQHELPPPPHAHKKPLPTSSMEATVGCVPEGVAWAELDRLVRRCLLKSERKRPSARDFLDDEKSVRHGMRLCPSLPYLRQPPTAPTPPSRRSVEVPLSSIMRRRCGRREPLGGGRRGAGSSSLEGTTTLKAAAATSMGGGGRSRAQPSLSGPSSRSPKGRVVSRGRRPPPRRVDAEKRSVARLPRFDDGSSSEGDDERRGEMEGVEDRQSSREAFLQHVRSYPPVAAGMQDDAALDYYDSTMNDPTRIDDRGRSSADDASDDGDHLNSSSAVRWVVDGSSGTAAVLPQPPRVEKNKRTESIPLSVADPSPSTSICVPLHIQPRPLPSARVVVLPERNDEDGGSADDAGIFESSRSGEEDEWGVVHPTILAEETRGVGAALLGAARFDAITELLMRPNGVDVEEWQALLPSVEAGATPEHRGEAMHVCFRYALLKGQSVRRRAMNEHSQAPREPA